MKRLPTNPKRKNMPFCTDPIKAVSATDFSNSLRKIWIHIPLVYKRPKVMQCTRKLVINARIASLFFGQQSHFFGIINLGSLLDIFTAQISLSYFFTDIYSCFQLSCILSCYECLSKNSRWIPCKYQNVQRWIWNEQETAPMQLSTWSSYPWCLCSLFIWNTFFSLTDFHFLV